MMRMIDPGEENRVSEDETFDLEINRRSTEREKESSDQFDSLVVE